MLEDLRWQVVDDEELQGKLQKDEAQAQIENFKLETGNGSEPPDAGYYKEKG